MTAARGADWLEAAVEALPVAVVVVEEGGTIAVANGQARSFLDLGPGDPAPAYLRHLVDVIADRKTVRETLVVASAHGSTVLAEVRAAPIAGGTVCTIEDLTERAQRERADREFITNAAHQLRTPITSIATAIEVLQAGAK